MFFKPFAAAVVLWSVSGLAHAQLQARDINGDGSIDAFFDVQQDLTWLADANYAATVGYAQVLTYQLSQPSEFMNWSQATTWASQLNYLGVGGWRLPDFLEPPGGVSMGGPFDRDYACSEVPGRICTLGLTEVDVLRGQIGAGLNPFFNYESTWIDSAFGAPPYALSITLRDDRLQRFITNETDALPVRYGAWAVRDGDVGQVTAIPEPSTYALMLAGLAAVAFAAKRRRMKDARLTA